MTRPPARRIIHPVQPRTARSAVLAEIDHDGRLLAPLHEVSKVLARFDSIDRMLAELFSVLTHAMPLRTLVLVEDRSGGANLRAWSAPGVRRARLALAEHRARATHDYLARRCPMNLSLGLGEDAESSAERSPLHGEPGLIALPLVSEDGRVFGVLQAEAAAPTDESDLAFLDAVSSGLAVSLDRHCAFRHEVEQRRRAEQLAVENARLYREAQTAIASRERLLAFVSHDLKTPLSSIALCVQALLSRAPPIERRNRARRQLEAIARCTDRMKHLVHDLVDAANIEAGQLALSCEPQPVSPILGEAMQLIQPLAAEHRLDLGEECPRREECKTARAGRCELDPNSGFKGDIEGELECGHHRPLQVNADKGRVVQVLVNLLANAIKFTGEHGRVSVSIKREDQAVRFSVKDTGAGIDPSQLPRVFDEFWRAEDTKHLGHGLGLYICKGIVEAHGGRIWAESEKGVGSTFHFTLPAA
ncbi:MAG: sensor histidine kinase [Myxococcaceae bacterium]